METTGAELQLNVGGTAYRCRTEPFELLDDSGEVLNPNAAAVLVALGGEEPSWLPDVDALWRVHMGFPGDGQALETAAAALSLPPDRQRQLAAVTNEPAQLVALAAIGCETAGRNPMCDYHVWDLLLYHRDPKVSARALRANPMLPPSLGGHKDLDTLSRVATNPACTLEQLTFLARAGGQVLRAVAANPSASQRLLVDCANHDDVAVRVAVARSPSCPRRSMTRLLRDRTAVVRLAMIANPKTPASLLRARLRDRTPGVHAALAARPDLGRFTLSRIEQLSRVDSLAQMARTHQALRANPRTSKRLTRRIDGIQRRLAELSPEGRRQLDQRNAALLDDTSGTTFHERELVLGWLFLVVVGGVALLVRGLDRPPWQPITLPLVVVGGIARAAVEGALVARLRGPFLWWYPTRIHRGIRVSLIYIPIFMIVFSIVFLKSNVQFMLEQWAAAWRRGVRARFAPVVTRGRHVCAPQSARGGQSVLSVGQASRWSARTAAAWTASVASSAL